MSGNFANLGEMSGISAKIGIVREKIF